MEIRLPRHVDMPQLIIAWTIDEVLPVVALLILGIFTEYFFTCLIAGVGLMQVVRRFRESKPDGYLLHWLYWHGMVPMNAPSVINPFQRRIDP